MRKVFGWLKGLLKDFLWAISDRDLLLIVLGMVLSYLIPHIQIWVNSIVSWPPQWRPVVTDILQSLPAILIILVVGIIITRIMKRQELKARKELEEVEDRKDKNLVENLSGMMERHDDKMIEAFKILINKKTNSDK